MPLKKGEANGHRRLACYYSELRIIATASLFSGVVDAVCSGFVARSWRKNS